MNSLYKASLLSLTLAACALVACGEQDDSETVALKGDAPLAPSPNSDGKADGLDSLTILGQLGFGADEAKQGQLAADAQLDAYEIDLSADADIALEITQRGSSRNLDTVLYVFGPKDPATGLYPDTVRAYDDDSGWGYLSKLRSVAPGEQGTYLVVVGAYSSKARGRYRLLATCQSANCTPTTQPPTPPVLATDETCVFGTTYRHFAHDTSPFVVVTERRRIDANTSLTTLEQAQTLAAISAVYTDAQTLAQGFASVDEQYVNQLHLWDASAQRAFVSYEFGAGENSYGSVFEAANTTVAAAIMDGDLYNCTPAPGPERQSCAQDADCAQGLRCFGVSEGQGACLDLFAPAPAGQGDICASTAACAQGLICAGESAGGGVCYSAWMKRGFEVELEQPISFGGQDTVVEVPINVFGLATVHTDVWINLWMTHPDPASLHVSLVNPSGTSAQINAIGSGELYLAQHPLLGYPGDESANGRWTLRIASPSGAPVGQLHELAITMMTRWD